MCKAEDTGNATRSNLVSLEAGSPGHGIQIIQGLNPPTHLYALLFQEVADHPEVLEYRGRQGSAGTTVSPARQARAVPRASRGSPALRGLWVHPGLAFPDPADPPDHPARPDLPGQTVRLDDAQICAHSAAHNTMVALPEG